jgi:hypothetical protein
MTDYDPHLRRLMRTLVQRAASQDASAAAWLRQEFTRGLDGVEAGAEPYLGVPATDGDILSSTVAGVRSWVTPGATGWHGHLHRISTAVTLPADHSLWLGTLDLGTGGSLTIESGAILQIG